MQSFWCNLTISIGTTLNSFATSTLDLVSISGQNFYFEKKNSQHEKTDALFQRFKKLVVRFILVLKAKSGMLPNQSKFQQKSKKKTIGLDCDEWCGNVCACMSTTKKCAWVEPDRCDMSSMNIGGIKVNRRKNIEEREKKHIHTHEKSRVKNCKN